MCQPQLCLYFMLALHTCLICKTKTVATSNHLSYVVSYTPVKLTVATLFTMKHPYIHMVCSVWSSWWGSRDGDVVGGFFTSFSKPGTSLKSSVRTYFLHDSFGWTRWQSGWVCRVVHTFLLLVHHCVHFSELLQSSFQSVVSPQQWIWLYTSAVFLPAQYLDD